MTPEHRAYRPKRHLRHEIYSLALVLAAPLGVMAIFPFASLSFHPAESSPSAVHRPACSFVVLTDEQADAAVQAARSAIKTSHEGISTLRADLSIFAVPAERGGVADVGERQGVAPVGDVPYDVLPLPKSFAAPKPARTPSDPAANVIKPPCSRDDLLEIWE